MSGLSRRRLFTFDFGSPRRDAGHWLRVHRMTMACRFEVTLDDAEAGHIPAARKALDEADRLEALLSVFRDSSELSRINRGGASGVDGIDPEVVALLTRCAALSEETGGAFDITSTPLSRCWGFFKRDGRVPADDEIETARASVGMHRVAIDADARHVRFERPGVELNLGAIGKGYALDRMGALLRERHVGHALLSAGASSILAIGGRGGGWSIDVRSPLVTRDRLARVHLRDGALGTSGAGEQFVVHDGRRYGHVIDPRTGWPADGVLSASVITREAARADALSTAFLIGGAALAETYCAAHPETLALITLAPESRPMLFGAYPGATVTVRP